VTDQHTTTKNRNSTLLRLRMRTAEADQSLRAMLSRGQSTTDVAVEDNNLAQSISALPG
jgi:hypothetical protein